MNLGLKLEEVRDEVLELLGADIGSGGDPETSEPGGEPPASPRARARRRRSTAFGRDLTELAKRGKLDPVIGRKREIERVIQVLCRRTKNNPVLLGEAGVGKTAIVEGLAQTSSPATSRRS
jgi:ATP-dependent Clp protease ATP-binding subunit ClpC